MKHSRLLLTLLLLAPLSAAAQESPIPSADNVARGKTGVWTNLSTEAQAAVHAEAAAAALNIASAVSINSVVHWSGKFTYKPTGKVFPYTMIGTHPFNNPVTSTIPVTIIPLRFVFDGYLVNGKPLVFDPASILPKVKASPVWTKHDYGFGAAQYIDALQRNSFSRTNGYHVLLGTPKTLATHVIHVSNANGNVRKTSKGYVGIVNATFLLNLISHLPHNLGVKPNVLPLMVSLNVYGGDSPDDGFYYYGFHGDTQISTTPTSQTVQLWAWSSWIGPGWFGNTTTLDITGITHELAEAADDPFLNNNAPTYGYPYNTSACSSIIEIGDVTEGLGQVAAPVKVNAFTYHPANVAMIPWFSRTVATTTTGSYSFPNPKVLTTPATNCQ